MKAFWKYELKRNLRLLIILLAVCIVPLIVNCAQSELFWAGVVNEKDRVYAYDVLISYMAVVLGLLAVFLPLWVYSFKFTKRSVDTWYALPMKRWKIYFVKTMVGLFLMIVPFTAAYWLGAATLALRQNYYQMSALLPAYASLLFYGICIYGIVAFLLAQGNSAGDGLVFAFGHAALLPILLEVALSLANIVLVDQFVPVTNAERIYIRTAFQSYDLSFFGGMARSAGAFSNMFCGDEYALQWWWYVIAAIYGGLGYFGLFFAANMERAEDAEQISTSWFGYKLLLPIYTAVAAFTFSLGGVVIGLVGASVLGFIGYVVYRRKPKIEKRDWLCLVVSVLAGIIFALFL